MSKQNLEKAVRKELEVLNDQIDRKIIRGVSYVKESRRHKFLLSSLSRMHKATSVRSGWFTRSFSLVSTFLL